jgi:hypothetical protein
MMLYTGRDQSSRMDDPARNAEERRTFTRRIDCADAGRRQAVNPSPNGRVLREPLQGQNARRRLDID